MPAGIFLGESMFTKGALIRGWRILGAEAFQKFSQKINIQFQLKQAFQFCEMCFNFLRKYLEYWQRL